MSASDEPKEKKVLHTFTEVPSVIEELDRIAFEEGSSRAVLIRRALRLLIALEHANKETVLQTSQTA